MKDNWLDSSSAFRGAAVFALLVCFPAFSYAQDAGTPVQNATGAVSQLRSIKDIYDSGKPTDAVENGRIVLEFNKVSSRLVYFENEQWANLYYDPVDGKDIRKILESDSKLKLEQFDEFMEQNMHDMAGTSLFLDGYIVLGIKNPRYHIIVPVDAGTVNKIIRYLSRPGPQK